MTPLHYTMPLCSRSGSHPLRRPLIRVKLSNPHKSISWNTTALIDTGSDRCIFPAWIATELGHDLEAGSETIITGIYNDSTPAWLHTNIITLFDPVGNEVSYQCRTIFSRKIAPGYGVLGIEGFLTHFRLTIDYARHLIILEEHRSK